MSGWWDRMVWILTQRLYWTTDSMADIVYHAKGMETREGEPGDMTFRKFSRCGLELDVWPRERARRSFTMFQKEIAVKFARPCKQCFPEQS